MPATKTTKKPSTENVWSDEERAAMQEAARERRRTTSRRSPEEEREEGEREVLDKIASLDEPDRTIAGRIHAIVTAVAPDLVPRTFYGSPAYARNGTVLFFYQERAKFKARYGTLGFSDKAHLDDGSVWPISYAITDLTPADEERITALIRKAVG